MILHCTKCHHEATEALCAIDAALRGKDPAPPVQKGTG